MDTTAINNESKESVGTDEDPPITQNPLLDTENVTTENERLLPGVEDIEEPQEVVADNITQQTQNLTQQVENVTEQVENIMQVENVTLEENVTQVENAMQVENTIQVENVTEVENLTQQIENITEQVDNVITAEKEIKATTSSALIETEEPIPDGTTEKEAMKQDNIEKETMLIIPENPIEEVANKEIESEEQMELTMEQESVNKRDDVTQEQDKNDAIQIDEDSKKGDEDLGITAVDTEKIAEKEKQMEKEKQTEKEKHTDGIGKHIRSISPSQALIELLECDDPENFPYDFPMTRNDDIDTDVNLTKDTTDITKNDVAVNEQELKKEKSEDNPVFMHIDTEKDDPDKVTSAAEQDEVAVDPIGEPVTDWNQDDTECIVPDTNQSQDCQESTSKSTNDDNGDQSTSSGKAIDTIETFSNLSNGEEQNPSTNSTKEIVQEDTFTLNQEQTFIDTELGSKQLKEQNDESVIVRDLRVKRFPTLPEDDVEADVFRHCADCGTTVTDPDIYFSWECLEFCDLKCLKNYQKKIGSYCTACEMEVPDAFLGKYCVRFGFDVRQFCSGSCLIKYKKGLKVCSYCRENIQVPSEATASDGKVKAREFCTDVCKDNYTLLRDGKKETRACAVCHNEKIVEIEFSDTQKAVSFCSKPCFVAFKYVNNVLPKQCGMCSKYYDKKNLLLYIVNTVGTVLRFCSKTCQNIYINTHRKIVSCCWCKVKKYNFDMIQKLDGTQCVVWCSLNCYRLYETNCSSNIGKRRCSVCHKHGHMIYHITSDVGLKSFCSYKCVRDHQTKQMPTLRVADVNTVPTIIKRVTRKAGRKQITAETPAPLPIITSVRSLAPGSEKTICTRPISPDIEKSIKYVVMVRPPDLPDIRNVSTSVKPQMTNQETYVKPEMIDKETQTDIFNTTDMEVVPVPVYIPHPIHMYNFMHLKSIPFPLPIPVPILMPMTKTGTSGILKEVKTAQPTPSDPYEADLLVMAQLVADANDKEAEEDQAVESEPDDTAADDPAYSPEPQEQNTSFGDDVLQMALNMATDFTEPPVDLEGALTANTITATTSNEATEETTHPKPERATRGTRRRGRSSRGGRGRGRGRPITQPEQPPSEPVPEPTPEPTEKPDANMCLKYTFGVNAWKQWVTNKNNELEKSSRRVKLFKTDLLQLTSDELNYSLCMFVKEVRKPNGTEYAPDTIYYLCLGVQQYLFENGRIDNIFCDPYYESFTDCLDEICKKFSTLYNDSQYIVTRVEEEHLWESKQLGAHSPHVLLSTLMFFNTKHFNLTNVDEHMQLSFSHIMKHWKRVANIPGTSKNTTSRNILLRFYPPQSVIDGGRKKKVYEQQENEENPIRCPVKLYEFYLSKCPESVKTRNDVFYLQPERSCVPDSPVWYSTMALGRESLEKMLHRVKMVKEINVALLSS